MPKAKRSRLAKHEQPIPMNPVDDEVDMEELDEVSDREMADDRGEGTSMSGQLAIEEAEATGDTDGPEPQLKKRQKKKNRREALMQRIAERAMPVSPYSKSHNRRMKKKAKESLQLGSITAALAETAPEDVPLPDKPQTAALKASIDAERLSQPSKPAQKQSQKSSTTIGKIGGDTAQKNLSAKQRQKMLAQERTRLPAILAHKAFATSPFETIRLHAQNTVVPLEKSRRP